MSARDDYANEVAQKVIAALEAGTAPWVRPWRAGQPLLGGECLPFNATTGKHYRGGNAMHLLCQQMRAGYEDNRWMTYQQADAIGAQVRKGEKSTGIEYWKFHDKADTNGAEPAPGATKTERRPPSVFFARVFNAAQIDGLPRREPAPVAPEPVRHAEAERLIEATGADIRYGGNEAFYHAVADFIQLPPRAAFHTADGYYVTALHECGHWTGAASRLARDLTGRRGTEEYAREELRAEISSMMAGQRLGIGHDPGQHLGYVDFWIGMLKREPREILRACADAEKICTFLGIEHYEQRLEQQQSLEHLAQPAQRIEPARGPELVL